MNYAVGTPRQTPCARRAFSHNGAVGRSKCVGPPRPRQVSTGFVRNGGDGKSGGDQDEDAYRDSIKQRLVESGVKPRIADVAAGVAASFNSRLKYVGTELSSIKNNTFVMVFLMVFLRIAGLATDSVGGQFLHKVFPSFFSQ